MKVYNSVTIDIETNQVIAEDSYEYDGPLALADFGGGGDMSGAYESAAAAQAAAMQQALSFQKEVWAQNQQNINPYIQSGQSANTYYAGMLGIPGYDSVDPTQALQSTPGYEWTKNQGLSALGAQAASTGQYGSGAMGKGLINYATGLADTTYNNYANRVAGMGSQGLQAATGLGSLGQSTASNMGSLYGQLGSAQSQGILGSAMANQQQSQSGMQNMLGGLGLLGGLGMSALGLPLGGAGASLFSMLAGNA